jgi:hypothetical protein
VNNVARLMPPLYLTESDWKALKFIEAEHAQRGGDEVVLCMNLLGNYVPRETGCHAFVGHWAETLNFDKSPNGPSKLRQLQDFYSGALKPEEAVKWLKDNHIKYVVVGFYENGALNWSMERMQRLGLKEIFYASRYDLKREEPEEVFGTAVYAVP